MHHFVQKGSNAPPSTWSGSGMKNHTSNPTTHSTVRRLSPQELREKRYKSLCFYCDGKYRAGHKWKNQKILQLDILPDEDVEEQGWELDAEEEAVEPQPPIELSASLMARVVWVSSIRLIGKIQKMEVSFLVDSGDTISLTSWWQRGSGCHSTIWAHSN